jgi:transaldolase
MELTTTVDISKANITITDETSPTLINNTKGNRYYYKHREEILEKRRRERLAKKGVDVTTLERDVTAAKDEIRKKKLEILGLLGNKK